MNQVFCVIQSRTSSTRLPAKALLNIGNMPATILCAKRISNTGLPYILSTSNEASDDVLAFELARYGIKYHRGSLEDLTSRTYDATRHLEDENTIIVRLTADNLFVDGKFIEKFVRYFEKNNAQYLTTIYDGTNLPYGLTSQACRLKHVREIYYSNKGDFDDSLFVKISEKYGVSHFSDDDFKINQGNLRVTMDTFNDYLVIADIFNKFTDATQVSHLDLLQQLVKYSSAAKFNIPYKRKQNRFISNLSFGGAQIGLLYGITNQNKELNHAKITEMLNFACKENLRIFETANSYGKSEEYLGDFLDKSKNGLQTIVTKLSTLGNLPEDPSELDIKTFVDASVYQSCYKLGVKTIDFLLLHRLSHKTIFGEMIWDRLLQLQKDGIIENLGVSVYSPDEASSVLGDPNIKLIQIPFNILDRRWKDSGFIEKLKSRNDIILQVRSSLLQGILANPNANWPKIEGVNQVDVIAKINNFVRKFNRESEADLCYAYILGQSWVDTIVVGMENIEQLKQNLSLFSKAALSLEECLEIEATFQGIPEQFINPSMWNL